MTAKFLIAEGIEFYLVVEKQEYEEYASRYKAATILILPEASTGKGAIPVRNWIWEHSISLGFGRHWELDDNIRELFRLHKGKRIRCSSMAAFDAVEEFTDRYENIAISGLNYLMFGTGKQPPFNLNVHVYSCMLIKNDLPYRWRGKYNADTDLCLQVLSGNWCTILFNAFLCEKMTTMVCKGGNTSSYQGDGRLKMARALERVWPGVVTTDRKFQRPQHVIKSAWRRFDTQLIRRTDIDWTKFKTNNFGMKIIKLQPIKSTRLNKYFDEVQQEEKKS